jgi:hypothetical protein
MIQPFRRSSLVRLNQKCLKHESVPSYLLKVPVHLLTSPRPKLTSEHLNNTDRSYHGTK